MMLRYHLRLAAGLAVVALLAVASAKAEGAPDGEVPTAPFFRMSAGQRVECQTEDGCVVMTSKTYAAMLRAAEEQGAQRACRDRKVQLL